jgi:predicted transcriptional regulator
MKPTLLHLLFPRVRAEILRLLFTNPRTEIHVRELARLAYLAQHTIQVELKILSSAHLVVSRKEGSRLLYRANPAHPLYVTLRRLVIKSAGLRQAKSRSKRCTVAYRRVEALNRSKGVRSIA